MYQVVFFIIYYHTYYIWYKMCINIYLFKGAHMLTVTNLKYHFSTFLFGTPLFSHISNVSFMQNTILVPFISVIFFFFCVCARCVCRGSSPLQVTCGHLVWRCGRCWACVKSNRTVTWPMNRSLTMQGSFSETRADRYVYIF